MPAMRPAFEFGLRAFVVVAVFAFSSLDIKAISPQAIPLWAYVGAHLAILTGLFGRRAP